MRETQVGEDSAQNTRLALIGTDDASIDHRTKVIVLQCGRHALLVVQLLVDLILLDVSTVDNTNADFVSRWQRVE